MDDALSKSKAELNMAHAKELAALRLKQATERVKLEDKVKKSDAVMQMMQLEIKSLKARLDGLKGAENAAFKRPQKDSSSQTVVDPETAMWDKQNGWILPISKTARIRQLWRESIRFGSCPSCRGVGKFIHQVATVLRKSRRGSEVMQESIVEADLGKWALPDECVHFLSNLPHTVQALRPQGFFWALRTVSNIFALKFIVDRDDEGLGYTRQPLLHFVIERYLMHTEHRKEAEMRFYNLLRAVREHYRKHPLLQLFARFLGILDTVSAEEKAAIQQKEKQGESALRRKREADVLALNPRLRAKLVAHGTAASPTKSPTKWPTSQFPISDLVSKTRGAAEGAAGGSGGGGGSGGNGTPQVSISSFPEMTDRSSQPPGSKMRSSQQHNDRVFELSDRSLDLDVLNVCLFARGCLMYAPYRGVYAVRIAQAKSRCADLLSQDRYFRSIPSGAPHPSATVPAGAFGTDAGKRTSSVGKGTGGKTKDEDMLGVRATIQSNRDRIAAEITATASLAAATTATTTAPATAVPVRCWPEELSPLHVCIGEKGTFWVPLDRAVHVVRPLLRFMPRTKMSAIWLAMEQNSMFLMPDGTLDLPEGCGFVIINSHPVIVVHKLFTQLIHVMLSYLISFRLFCNCSLLLIIYCM